MDTQLTALELSDLPEEYRKTQAYLQEAYDAAVEDYYTAQRVATDSLQKAKRVEMLLTKYFADEGEDSQ